MSALILRPEFPDRRDDPVAIEGNGRIYPRSVIDREVRKLAEELQRSWSAAGDSVSMDVTVMEGEQRDE